MGETVGLPHHVGTAEKIDRLLTRIRDLLKKLASRRTPLAIMVARSRHDHYIPESKSDLVHHATMRLLCDVLRTELHEEKC